MAVVYALVFTRDGREDWAAVAIAVTALGAVPVLAALTLQAFGRHRTPLTSAVVTTAVCFAFAVALLSAFRVPLSYVGLAACLPIAAAWMVRANLAFQRMVHRRAALLDFAGAGAVLAMLDPAPRRILDPQDAIGDVDCVLIDPVSHHAPHWAPLLQRAYLAGAEIMPWSAYLELSLGRVDTDAFDVADIRHTALQSAYLQARRWLDKAAVLATLPVTLPLAALVALYLLVRHGRPILFVQVRRGLGGRLFRMVKFRTMQAAAPGSGAGAPASPGDARILPGAALLRRLRLDELPQLWNVLIGDMALVGPRPEALHLARAYERAIPGYRHRLLLTPGITGLAQVRSGYASDLEEVRVKLSHDLYYIRHVSPELDLRILAGTLRIVLLGQGAR